MYYEPGNPVNNIFKKVKDLLKWGDMENFPIHNLNQSWRPIKLSTRLENSESLSSPWIPFYWSRNMDCAQDNFLWIPSRTHRDQRNNPRTSLLQTSQPCLRNSKLNFWRISTPGEYGDQFSPRRSSTTNCNRICKNSEASSISEPRYDATYFRKKW